MITNKTIPLLTSDDIEVKIKKCTKAGAVALLYKTARVDYRILDEVFGQFGWQIEYEEIKGNLYCTISLWDEEHKQWIKKTNCGIESRSDGDGNEKKGEASDAAKRAGTVVGIGAELYSSPFIFLDVATVQDGSKYKLKDDMARYVVTNIKIDEKTRVITALNIANEKTGVEVFSWTMPTSGAKAKKMSKTVKEEKTAEPKAEKKEEKKAVESQKESEKVTPKAEPEKTVNEAKIGLKELIRNIGLIAKKIAEQNGDMTLYLQTVTEVTGDPAFKCSRATEDQYDSVLAIYKALVAKGYDN